MIDKTLVQKRIADIEHEIIPQDFESIEINLGRIEILYWFINNEVQDEEKIFTKIRRIQEEMIPLHINDLMYREKQARINELKYCLKDQ